MTYVPVAVAVYDRGKVTKHSKTGKITKGALREALRTDPNLIDFRIEPNAAGARAGYCRGREAVEHGLVFEVRENFQLVAVVHFKITDGVLQAVVS